MRVTGRADLRRARGREEGWPRLEDEGLDADSIILLEDEEEELEEVCSHNAQDVIALKWLIQTVKMAKDI